MKLFTLLPLLLISIHLFAQQEKGCTIRDAFRVYYESGQTINTVHSFSFIWAFSSLEDTVTIEENAHAEIGIRWSYFNEHYNLYYPAYDSVQWFYNDSIMDASDYSFSSGESGGGCGTKYSAGSKINNVKPGYYQLRYLGSPYGLTATNYPVVHVYDKASVLNQPEQEDHISIYPNPVRDKITVELSDPKKNLELHIYDLNGSRIESIDLDHLQKSSYSLRELSQGIYLCTLYDPEVSEVVYRIKLKKL